MEKKIVTLLTDFGTKDGYTGCVKGIIKSHCPEADIIDISHEIGPFDIKNAAFTLNTYFSCYPKGTIHVVVVDPGVGSERLPLIVRTAHHYFVGPDNGVFDFILAREAYTAFEIDIKKIQTVPSAYTFHARDIFAPVAAKLANGVSPEKLGRKLDNRTEIPHLFYKKNNNDLIVDAVAVDHFGNIISGFSMLDIERLNKKEVVFIQVKDFKTETINRYYQEKGTGELMALWNSQGFLEIAATQASAREILRFDHNNDKIRIRVK